MENVLKNKGKNREEKQLRRDAAYKKQRTNNQNNLYSTMINQRDNEIARLKKQLKEKEEFVDSQDKLIRAYVKETEYLRDTYKKAVKEQGEAIKEVQKELFLFFQLLF